MIAVVGPTATGKSELALDLAEAVGGEVVNADASQLYRGMDIGTAKLHLTLGAAYPITSWTSSTSRRRPASRHTNSTRARTWPRSSSAEAPDRGRRVGPVRSRPARPARDPAHRPRGPGAVGGRGRRLGTALYARLRGQDTVAAEAIEPNNTRRVVRALEVIELTGRRFSATMPTREYVRPTVAIGLEVPREVLDQRIAARVTRMWQDGLLDEVRSLEAMGLRRGGPPRARSATRRLWRSSTAR